MSKCNINQKKLPEFFEIPKLLQDTLLKSIDSELTTPLIILCKDIIKSNLFFFSETLNIPVNDIFFAVKANNDPRVLHVLEKSGSNFEIASSGELDLLKQLNINPTRILFSNPVKISSHIKAAYDYGIKRFAFDTEEELKKISIHAPLSEVYLRFNVSNHGAGWKLEGKFGAEPENAVNLLKKAVLFNLKPLGITFHVGWDNKDIKAWEDAVERAVQIVKRCLHDGLYLQFVDLGGGFPAHAVSDQYYTLQSIGSAIAPHINTLRNKYNLAVFAEPGSFIINNCAAMVASVYSIINRGSAKWVFIDSSINHGFIWIYNGIEYHTILLNNTDKADKLKRNKIEEPLMEECIITGPTCDSEDVFGRAVLLPDTLKEGDYICIYPAGGYTNSSKNYNGFDFPKLHIV
ncbi:MAG: hypothetical protein HQK63_08570 [Desulfamplus sp.]|nr:hypothetical protein [Desulfamplus sp.]